MKDGSRDQFRLTIDTSGPDFTDRGEEIARHLRELAGRLDDGEPSGHVRDRRGQSIGKFYTTPKTNG